MVGRVGEPRGVSMTFAEAVNSVLRQYAIFRGRARRAEYWWFILFTLLVSLVAGVIDTALGTTMQSGVGFVGTVASLALLLPTLAVTVRRLHDTDRSGWWVLAFLIPIVGFELWLVFMLSDSNPEPNRFGASPKQFGVAPGPGPVTPPATPGQQA
jgi:uncharacterized membrane protein YhaH (DUF805 family)